MELLILDVIAIVNSKEPKLYFNEKYSYKLIKAARARQLKSNALVSVFKSNHDNDFFLDQLLNLIYLYSEECNLDEVSYWMKNDWDIKISVQQIANLYKNLSSKRLFTKTNKIYVINNISDIDVKNKADFFEYKDIYYTKNKDYHEGFLYYRDGFKDINSKRNKIQIGNPFSFIDFKDKNGFHQDIENVLMLKRFSGAYHISDLRLIEMWSEFHSESVNKIQLNKMMSSIQLNFIKEYCQINKRLG